MQEGWSAGLELFHRPVPAPADCYLCGVAPALHTVPAAPSRRRVRLDIYNSTVGSMHRSSVPRALQQACLPAPRRDVNAGVVACCVQHPCDRWPFSGPPFPFKRTAGGRQSLSAVEAMRVRVPKQLWPGALLEAPDFQKVAGWIVSASHPVCHAKLHHCEVVGMGVAGTEPVGSKEWFLQTSVFAHQGAGGGSMKLCAPAPWPP